MFWLAACCGCHVIAILVPIVIIVGDSLSFFLFLFWLLLHRLLLPVIFFAWILLPNVVPDSGESYVG